jgi:hypothetical protein
MVIENGIYAVFVGFKVLDNVTIIFVLFTIIRAGMFWINLIISGSAFNVWISAAKAVDMSVLLSDNTDLTLWLSPLALYSLHYHHLT